MLQTYWKYDKKNDLNHLEFPGITVWEGTGKEWVGTGKGYGGEGRGVKKEI